jgi:esterase/lipase superfamily enzyme
MRPSGHQAIRRQEEVVVRAGAGKGSRLVVLAGLAFVLAACAGTPTMMPPPIAVSRGLAKPLDGLPEALRGSDLDVFFATDRSPDDPAACRYGDELGDMLRLGVATVRLGEPEWTWPELVERSVTGEKVPLACTGAREFGGLWSTISPTAGERYRAARDSRSPDDPVRAPARRFARAIDARLAGSPAPDVYVFVSGFNTTFEQTVERFAQFAHFARRGGVFLAYSWPTRLSFLSYVEDTQKGELSVRNLRELILFLGRETQVGRIHLIGYSAGARILAKALLEIRLLHADADPATLSEKLRIGRLLFPAPDLDLNYARNLELDRFADVAERVAIYVSEGDVGIWASARLVFNAPRLGNPFAGLTESDLEKARGAQGADFVDSAQALKSAGSDWFGHAYWYANPWVSTDALLFLLMGLPPEQRGLVRAGSDTHWAFPEDYPERLRGVMEALETRR